MVLKDRLLVVNPVKKPKSWHLRHSWEMRGGTPPDQGWIENGLPRVTIVSPTVEVVVPGNKEIPIVRCNTFVFTDTAPEVEDGAVVTVAAGGLTPPQYIESETTFHEIPLRGRLLFLCVSPGGHFSSHYFEVAERQNSPFLAEVRQG